VYLLDTNVCIRVLNASSKPVIARFSTESPATLRLCSVVKAELFYGARKSRRVAKTLSALRLFLEPFECLAFGDEAAEHYGAIRADLERAGTPIGANDLMIAAIARQHDLTVVTHDMDDFGRVVGLRVEDWERAPGS
jgi:tRNA(fMet)-specific endonuclease VapC